MGTPEESKAPYSLDDVDVGTEVPPPDIDDDRTKAEAAYYDKEAKALGNIETAIKISFFKRYMPLVFGIAVGYYVVVIILIILSGFHVHGFRLDPTVQVALLAGPLLVALLGLMTKVTR